MAKKPQKRLIGAKLLKPSGSLMFCENCETIVGSINPKGYEYIYIHFLCACGNDGTVEIMKNGCETRIFNYLNRSPAYRRGVCVCSGCSTPLFSMVKDRLQNYSFYAECSCREKYDTVPSFGKRLGETMKLYSELKKKK